MDGGGTIPRVRRHLIGVETMASPVAEAVGIDVGDRFAYVVRVDASGEVVERARFKSEPGALRKFFEGRAPLAIAIETGTHARWMHRELTSLGHEVVIANARKLRAISANENKSDWNDAEMLARLRRADPKLLYPVGTRSEADWESLALVRARDQLIDGRTALVNCVRGLVKAAGARLPSCDAEYFHRKVEELIPDGLRPAVLPLLKSIETMTEQAKAMEKRIGRRLEERYSAYLHLLTIPGVGPITVLAFVAAIGDPARFSDSRDVGSYFGLRPGRDQSGEQDPMLPITKCGDEYVRRLLVGSGQYILGPFGPPSELREWGEKLIARGGKAARKRAAVAVGRKLCVTMHRMMVTGRPWCAYPNGLPPEKKLKMVRQERTGDAGVTAAQARSPRGRARDSSPRRRQPAQVPSRA